MSSVAEWQKEATPHSQEVEVCFDRQLVAEMESAQAQLRAASKGQLQAPPDLKARAEALEAQVRAKTRVFVFSSIGRRAWRALLSEHPPTPEQKLATPRDAFGNEIDHDPETFPIAAMVATCTSPGLTEEEAQWIAEELPERVYLRFWNAVLNANILGGDEKKAVATAAAPASELR